MTTAADGNVQARTVTFNQLSPAAQEAALAQAEHATWIAPGLDEQVQATTDMWYDHYRGNGLEITGQRWSAQADGSILIEIQYDLADCPESTNWTGADELRQKVRAQQDIANSVLAGIVCLNRDEAKKFFRSPRYRFTEDGAPLGAGESELPPHLLLAPGHMPASSD